MEKETTGTVISVSEQWWFKLNTQALRRHSLGGAIFPHVVKVQYTVDGREYLCRKWYSTGMICPAVGQTVTVVYNAEKPSRCRFK